MGHLKVTLARYSSLCTIGLVVNGSLNDQDTPQSVIKNQVPTPQLISRLFSPIILLRK